MLRDETEAERTLDRAPLDTESRFRAAVEGSLDAFFILRCERDASGAIIDFFFDDMNARGALLLRAPREELLGKRLCTLLPRSRANGFFDKYAHVVESGEAMEEMQAIHGTNGVVGWIHHQMVPLVDGLSLTARDITAQKRIEQELREALEQQQRYADELAEKNRQLTEENAERLRVEQITRAQQEAMRAMSTPILRAWEGVLALPIIGILDEERATQMMERLLREIVASRARFAILDLTGVESVDGATLSRLLGVVRAASLLGSRCLIAGISPAIARGMVELGVAGVPLLTFGLFHDALRYALRALEEGSAPHRGSARR